MTRLQPESPLDLLSKGSLLSPSDIDRLFAAGHQAAVLSTLVKSVNTEFLLEAGTLRRYYIRLMDTRWRRFTKKWDADPEAFLEALQKLPQPETGKNNE